jgi:hypothetical protein
MFVRTGKHKKKQKTFFFNYFLIYLVAILVIIALCTKHIILIIRCRINRNCFDIYSQIKLDGLSLKFFLYNPVPNKKKYAPESQSEYQLRFIQRFFIIFYKDKISSIPIFMQSEKELLFATHMLKTILIKGICIRFYIYELQENKVKVKIDLSRFILGSSTPPWTIRD